MSLNPREELGRLLSLINDLERATGPDRDLDYQIAQVTGWKTHQQGEKVIWLSPDALEQTRVPKYTKFLHDAYYLAHQISPDHVGGMAWEPGMGSAKIDDYPAVQSCSPAIALCIAALLVKKAQDVAAFKRSTSP